MSRRLLIFAAWLGCAIGSVHAAAPSASPPSLSAARQSATTFERQIKPLLRQYCYGCHGDTKRKAGLSLQACPEAATVGRDRAVWEKVLHHVRNQEMPPESEPQPRPAERERLAQWIQDALFPVDCDHPDPGRVTLRRLNRAEYNNTIRDLVGVDFQPAEDFPPDDSGYGFDNIGDVLSLSPLHLEKYLAAAEKILDQAIAPAGASPPPAKTFSARDFKFTTGRLAEDCCFLLFTEGEVFVTHTVTNAGEYLFRVQAYGQQAGPDPARLALRLDGQEVKRMDVREVESAPGVFAARVPLAAGVHRFAAAFLNDYYNEKDPDPANRDRNLIVQSLEIAGPLNPPPASVSDAHRRLFICQPAPGTTNQCVRTILANFARRAFRRPVTTNEVQRLTQLAERALTDGESFEQSVKLALEAVLVSPRFLFRGELQPEPDNPRVVRPIDEFALATRLSYFLWSSTPDDPLLLLAERGQLRQQFEPQVRRMLKDPRSRALVDNFGGQWLQTRNLKLATPDSREFPAWDEELRAAMQQETELLFDCIQREDRSVLEFLTADYTFVNERLAKHYGLAGVRGSGFRRVSLKGTARGGVLTHGSILTLTSNPTRTSPVKRGKWVLENLLNAAPPPPPPDVPPLGEARTNAGATLRQRMEEHRVNPSCSSCHTLMDPIGFALENFDGIGAWRDTEAGQPIDASGRLGADELFRGAAELRQLLAREKRDAFARAFAEKLLTYALGRGLEYYDRCAVDQIVRNAARRDYRFSALVLETVHSVPFQMRRGEAARAAAAP